ncbi:sensor histidine kinase [Sphingomonas sp. LY160]|uniref:sensor histidine kinase n=1 Tax=Sphingomonas sp. LY160 TaxID=3095342 RepID=UPI002ADEA961|nr:histidine kinase dimerization/phospho-acceptor domain-containing protein [Sphingomonas sp. LY160]MEA1071190.1 hypothetical protein [Sphingomonas sp. LY160]
MRFDDRLKTVMTQSVADDRDRAVRWRQLVDLLSRPHDHLDPALSEAALTMVRSEMGAVDPSVRAATARSIAGRPVPAALLRLFVKEPMSVAAPLIASAHLDDTEWAMLRRDSSNEVAAFIDTLRPPAPEETVVTAPEVIAELAKPEVEKPSPRHDPVPTAPAAAPTGPNLFRWECDASGQIAWVEGAPRGALIGRAIAAEEGADRLLVRAFADRIPFDGATLTFPAPALDGEWRLSGIPAFSPSDGRFIGYRGIARRDGDDQAQVPSSAISAIGSADADMLRETIHEIKTPLNAIIGFAEIIDGQYLGPAHRNYRSRAAEIVTQARVLLGAIEDLDFAARMRSSRASAGAATALDTMLPPLADELVRRAKGRDVELRVSPPKRGVRCQLEQDLAERLLRRLVGAVIDASVPGERVQASFREDAGMCVLDLSLPVSAQGLSDERLFDPAFATASEDGQSPLGLGFALRLVRGLASLAGGKITTNAGGLSLGIPKA